MKINVAVQIGTEGRNCWRCQFAPSCSFCELFRVKLMRSEGAAQFERCEACLEAKTTEQIEEERELDEKSQEDNHVE